MPRYALLEHTGAPDDPSGCHYDLLLENGDYCRARRLPHQPAVGVPAQAAVELAPIAWCGSRRAAPPFPAGGVGPAALPMATTPVPCPATPRPRYVFSCWMVR